MPDMSEADRVKEDAARALAIAIRAWEHGKFELADILTAQAAQHLDDAALIEAADEARLKKAIGEIERVSAELQVEIKQEKIPNAIKMLVGPWYVDEFGNPTREIARLD